MISLARDLPARWSTGSTDLDLGKLSGYVMTARYGGVVVTKDEADRALDIATAVVRAMRSYIHG